MGDYLEPTSRIAMWRFDFKVREIRPCFERARLSAAADNKIKRPAARPKAVPFQNEPDFRIFRQTVQSRGSSSQT
jgi:hypothetical protein